MNKKETILIKNVDAAIFDLDGVVTSTASVHASAWKEMFDEYLEKKKLDVDYFNISNDYLKYIDGKPRYEGVKSFLSSRGIELEYGTPEDPPEKDTICGLGNRKNFFFSSFFLKKVLMYLRMLLIKLKIGEGKGLKPLLFHPVKIAKRSWTWLN